MPAQKQFDVVINSGATDWISLSDDSHHRGVLVFPRGLELGAVELTIEIGGEQLALHREAVPVECVGRRR